MKDRKFTSIIGLEVHIELKTKSKMFCGCLADYFGKEPNTHVCPICLGLPGTLPVPNQQAIEWCLMIGLALNCKIPQISKFDRKNYFYPDLPKGYQISQYDKPFCVEGWIDVVCQNDKKKRIRIRRVHMEEDTAKLIHQFRISNFQFLISNKKEKYSLIDFNRSGVPLVEIVTEPDFENVGEVVEYLKKLQQIVRYLGVSEADMEKGEMRLEPNVSLLSYTSGEPFGHPRGGRDVILPNYKVEIKNINSFKFVEKAISYEIKRQEVLLQKGEMPKQETRGWDEKKQVTLPQRGKEEVHDYRYFPEPDIPPIRWEKSQIVNLKLQIPELPDMKFDRFKKEYGLPDYDVEILTREKETADYFEEAIRVAREISNIKYQISNKQIANWIINKKINLMQILPAQLVQTIISAAKTGLMDEKELEKVVKQVLLDNTRAVSDYKKGKTQVLGFLIGQVRKSLNQPIDVFKIKALIKEGMKKI